jgi:NAD+ kinase
VTGSQTARLEGPIRAIGLVYRTETPEILSIMARIEQWASDNDIDVALETSAEDAAADSPDLEAGPVDLVLALGGDGTLLRAARMFGATDTPILGINLGRLGFLTALPDSYLEGGLHQVIAGEAFLDYRFRLRAHIEKEEEVINGNFFALNDIVVHTTGAARVTPLVLHVSHHGRREEVGSFSADGVILATPTGSTAYSMSAGGPIIVPAVQGVVITPICPHSLAARPLVIPADEEICVGSLDPNAAHQVTVDGQEVHRLAPDERVVVNRDDRRVALVRLAGQTFFDTMRRKLNWAIQPPERT